MRSCFTPMKFNLKLVFTFFVLNAIVFVSLLYNEKLVAEYGVQTLAWSLNTLSSLKSENLDLFHLPEKYRRLDNNNRTIILYWNTPFESIPGNPVLGDDCFQTLDRSAIDYANAVVFHFRETLDTKYFLPTKNRNPKQIWIWQSQEPPSHTLHDFKKTLTPLNGVFNWTMTYRYDSDIVNSYRPPLTAYVMDVSEFEALLMKKTESALGIAVISNCGSNFRLQYLNELSRHMKINIFGKCSGNFLCRGECSQQVISRYKFYFAFENSLCKNYISEKFWFNALSNGAVPVVMGASKKDYQLIAPNHSFIHVDDFPTAEKLAEYLTLLDQNDHLYRDYLKWRLVPNQAELLLRRIESSEPAYTKGLKERVLHHDGGGLLEVCQKLRRTNLSESRTLEHLDKWWYGDDYTPKNKRVSTCWKQDVKPYLIWLLIAKGYFVLILLFLLALFLAYCTCIGNILNCRK